LGAVRAHCQKRLFPFIRAGALRNRPLSKENIMSDRLINIDNLCTNPENHASHICELTRAGKLDQVAALQKDPVFICNNCGNLANQEGALCAPGPYHD
jgi:hypothetical protein